MSQLINDPDINDLLNEGIMDYIDTLSGIPKYILTIIGKIAEEKYLI